MQGYHTAVVTEERCTREVSDRDTAIEALKAEIERLEGEKGVYSTPLRLFAFLWWRRNEKRMV